MAKRKIEEFQLGPVLGVGTVGTIYRAHDLTHDNDVALKLLLPSVSREPLIAARFEREMAILEKLSHPNIVRYYGGGRTGEQLFFAMELLTGGSLKDLLGSGPLSTLETATCGIQICRALQYAHNHGIIHRDLKPSNLLFDVEGHLKLVDFGIARDTFSADITNEGLTVGSYAYMAPEQIRGDRAITGHMDLYALGCLLHEMLTAWPPFTGDNFAQLLEQHLHHAPPSIRDRNPTVPAELEELVNALLSKSAEDRPFNARAAQASLMKLLDARYESLQQDDEDDVPASQVIDVGRHALAKRIRDRPREVSWRAMGAIAIAAMALVLAAWLYSSQAN